MLTQNIVNSRLNICFLWPVYWSATHHIQYVRRNATKTPKHQCLLKQQLLPTIIDMHINKFLNPNYLHQE